MDTTSFFQELAPGVDNDASGVITLLAVAEALGKLKRLVSGYNKRSNTALINLV